MGIDEHVCPVCGQPVATVVRRHKTLGAWVPVWGPGPCRNHECAVYVDKAVEAMEAAAEKPRAVARRTHGSHGAHGGHGGGAGHGGHAGQAGRAGRPGEAEAVAEPTELAEATDPTPTPAPAPAPAEERTEEKA